MTQKYPLTLLYDASCPVCALEMDHLRARNDQGLLAFIDISAAGFDASRYGITLQALNAEIHGVWPDGTSVRGVQALRLAYGAAGLGWVLRPTGWPLLKPVFDAGYRVFARHRQTISRTCAPLIRGVRSWRAARVARRMRACSAGACEMAHRTSESTARSTS